MVVIGWEIVRTKFLLSYINFHRLVYVTNTDHIPGNFLNFYLFFFRLRCLEGVFKTEG